MPRFFFDFRQGPARSVDSHGVELPDAEQAYLEGVKAAQDMWSELLRQRRDPRRCAFEVRVETGDTLFILPFQEVLESCTDARKMPIQRTFNDVIQTYNYAERVRAEFMREVQNTKRVLRDSRDLLRQQVR